MNHKLKPGATLKIKQKNYNFVTQQYTIIFTSYYNKGKMCKALFRFSDFGKWMVVYEKTTWLMDHYELQV